MKKRHHAVVFKPYQQHQTHLLPQSLDDLIAPGHPVRIVSQIVDRIDIEPLLSTYRGGGRSSYHPRMLLKVLIYAYITNVYSSRKIEAELQQNVHYMWLAGMDKPDHHTINRFRSSRLKSVIKEVFAQVVQLLADTGHLSLKEVYVDGTKLEANANRYSFVWGKSVRINKDKLVSRVQELWQYTLQVTTDENIHNEEPDFSQLDGEKIQQTVERIDKALKGKPISAKIRKLLTQARRNWASRFENYRQKEQILAGRNSYSKTDTDATFMPMKEDHLNNAQPKPGYNVQISSNNQLIVNYSVHQTPSDTTTLPEHLDEHKRMYDQAPEVVVADAGYGSEENYVYLDTNGTEAYVKHNHFHAEHNGKISHKRTFAVEHLHYNAEHDFFVCPMGQRMHKVADVSTKSANQYQRARSEYRAANCNGCPLRGPCHKTRGNRSVVVSIKGMKLKVEASARLKSEKGIAYRKKRCHDVETVFANIKFNKGFRRCRLRGMDKVNIEIGLIALAHNLKKIAV